MFGEEGVKKAVSIEVPDNLDFKPFRADPNPSETYLLICKYDSDAPTYYLYGGTILHEISVLNDRAFGTVEPSHVRWHSDDELIYDIENLETGKYTTYLYQIQTQKEIILLADYDPFPFPCGRYRQKSVSSDSRHVCTAGRARWWSFSALVAKRR